MGAVNSFVSRVAEQALGRMIAQAPDKILSLLTSSVSVRVEVGSLLYDRLMLHLDNVATCLGRVPYEYSMFSSDYGETVSGISGGCISVGYRYILYLVRQRPLLLSATRSGKDVTYSITYLRGFDIKTLLMQAASQARFARTGSLWKPKSDLSDLNSMEYLSEIKHFWKSPAYQALEQDYRAWFASKKALQGKSLPWKRGWLLHGPPGNGKTFALRCLASNHRLNLLSLNLNIRDEQFVGLWNKIRHRTPILVVIEDIDDVIQGRTNVRDPQHGVAFSTLLNCIDGVDNTDGVIVAITTNRLDAIDPALGRPRDESQWNQLSTRPGRLDRCVRFDNPDLEGRLALARILLSEEKARQLAEVHTDLSTVQFQALCREAAFTEHQDLSVDS